MSSWRWIRKALIETVPRRSTRAGEFGRRVMSP
jgi:hypothetical protein